MVPILLNFINILFFNKVKISNKIVGFKIERTEFLFNQNVIKLNVS
jgi:hypothetical protein